MKKQDLIFKGGSYYSQNTVAIRFTYPGGLTMVEFTQVGNTNFFRSN